MAKDITKIRILILTAGIVLFSILAISTVVEVSLDEDYIGFQIFRNHLRINRFLIIDEGHLPLNQRGEHIDTIVNELDLSLYMFKDSSLSSMYRKVNRSYYESVITIEKDWEKFTKIFFSSDNKDKNQIEVCITSIVLEVENVNDFLSALEQQWHIIYTLVIGLNLLIFLTLLILVYILSGDKDFSSSTGIMSVRNALIEGQEKERLRISLELHDKVAQDLFACRMLINDVSSNTEEKSISASIIKSLSLLDASIKEVRDLSYSLRPPALQAIGLDSAFQSYIDNFSGKIETPITFKAVGLNKKNIDETVSINLYRILQETLNNTAKHAHADNIDIKLIYTYPYLLLKIEDDGVGFKYVKSEVKARGRNKLGLPGINERVSLLGGELIINTEKGEGTKILIKVPVVGNEKV